MRHTSILLFLSLVVGATSALPFRREVLNDDPEYQAAKAGPNIEKRSVASTTTVPLGKAVQQTRSSVPSIVSPAAYGGKTYPAAIQVEYDVKATSAANLATKNMRAVPMATAVAAFDAALLGVAKAVVITSPTGATETETTTATETTESPTSDTTTTEPATTTAPSSTATAEESETSGTSHNTQEGHRYKVADGSNHKQEEPFATTRNPDEVASQFSISTPGSINPTIQASLNNATAGATAASTTQSNHTATVLENTPDVVTNKLLEDHASSSRTEGSAAAATHAPNIVVVQNSFGNLPTNLPEAHRPNPIGEGDEELLNRRDDAEKPFVSSGPTPTATIHLAPRRHPSSPRPRCADRSHQPPPRRR
ncbi:hypothetical protein DFJ73DRAFT_373526 [Zopfochytrium polystomum]|nr:hypothetical protein DFJ73DRAFT_373526 [Zopfochytrium polystomum]